VAVRRRLLQPPPHRRHGGYALVFLLAIIVSTVLYTIVSPLSSVTAIQLKQAGQTADALHQAKDALIGYAITYRDTHSGEVPGYLPCPDIDGDGSADTNLTSGECGLSGNAAIGLLPYKQLGLPDLRDEDGVCLWYAVSANFKAATSKATPMNWDTHGQFIIDGDTATDTPVDAGTGKLTKGGAAAVIFAVGAPLSSQGGRSSNATTCGINPSEVAKYLDGNYNFATSDSIALSQGQRSSSSNNDRMLWISPKEIFDKVKKRSDFATQINGLSSALVSALTPTTPGAALTPQDAPTTVGSKKVGLFPATTSVIAAWTNYRDSWRDNYRYVVCNTASKCLKVNSATANCQGALIFTGDRSAGGPRTSLEKADDASYLDAANYSAYTSTSGDTFAGNISYSTSTSTQDAVYCLNSPDFTDIVGTSGFTAATTSATTTNFATSGRLGTSTFNASDQAGCAWYPTKVSFANGLRVFFKMTLYTRDSGLTFAIVDAVNNPDTGSLCGGEGKYLGYAGTDSLGRVIKPPKIGLEIDTYRDGNAGDPDVTVSSLTASGRHVALVYWGSLGSPSVNYTDDNTHQAGTLGSSTSPQNPAAVNTTFSTYASPSYTYYYVRLDISRSYTSPTGSYTLKAYVYPNSPTVSCLSSMNDLSDDLSTLDGTCTAKIISSITIDDSLVNSTEAMKQVYLGFTTGQRGSRSENIGITNFEARNH